MSCISHSSIRDKERAIYSGFPYNFYWSVTSANLLPLPMDYDSGLDRRHQAWADVLCAIPSLQADIIRVRDPSQQEGQMQIPQQYLTGHAYHTYHLTSPDGTVNFEFQHNVLGRQIYAEGTVDAALFLAKKIREGSEKRIFDMVDVLREGSMR